MNAGDDYLKTLVHYKHIKEICDDLHSAIV